MSFEQSAAGNLVKFNVNHDGNAGISLQNYGNMNHTLGLSQNEYGNITENIKMNDDRSSVIGLVQAIDRFIESLKLDDLNERKSYNSNIDHVGTFETSQCRIFQEQKRTTSALGSMPISKVNTLEFHEKLVTRDEELSIVKKLDFKNTAQKVTIRDIDLMSQTKRIKFPQALHQLLEEADYGFYSDIISWNDHGMSFGVKNIERFVNEIMPRFFKQTKIRSFKRQLSLYGFHRITNRGKEFGCYYHENFRRGHSKLACTIRRTAIKGWSQTTKRKHVITDGSISVIPVEFVPNSTMISVEKQKVNVSISDIEVLEEDSWRHEPWSW